MTNAGSARAINADISDCSSFNADSGTSICCTANFPIALSLLTASMSGIRGVPPRPGG